MLSRSELLNLRNKIYSNKSELQRHMMEEFTRAGLIVLKFEQCESNDTENENDEFYVEHKWNNVKFYYDEEYEYNISKEDFEPFRILFITEGYIIEKDVSDSSTFSVSLE